MPWAPLCLSADTAGQIARELSRWGATKGWCNARHWALGQKQTQTRVGPINLTSLPLHLLSHVFQLATATDAESEALSGPKVVACQLAALASVSRTCCAACKLVPVDVGLQYQQVTDDTAAWLCSRPVRTLLLTDSDELEDCFFYDVLQPAKTGALRALVGQRFFQRSSPCLERLVGFYQAQQLSPALAKMGWETCLASCTQLRVLRLLCQGNSFDSSCLSSLRHLRELDLANISLEESRLHLLPSSIRRLGLGPTRRDVMPFSLGALHFSRLTIIRLGHLRVHLPGLLRQAEELELSAEFLDLSIGEYASEEQLLDEGPEDLAAMLSGKLLLSYWGTATFLLAPRSAAFELSVPSEDFYANAKKSALHALSIKSCAEARHIFGTSFDAIMRASVPLCLGFTASEPLDRELVGYLCGGRTPVASIEWDPCCSGLPALQRQLLNSHGFQRSSAASLQKLQGLELESVARDPIDLSHFSCLTCITGRLAPTRCSTAASPGSAALHCARLASSLKQLELQPSDREMDSSFHSGQLHGLGSLHMESLSLLHFKSLDLQSLPKHLDRLHLSMTSSSWHLSKDTLISPAGLPAVDEVHIEVMRPGSDEGDLACLTMELQPWLLAVGKLSITADVVDVVCSGIKGPTDLARLLRSSKGSILIEAQHISFVAAGVQPSSGGSSSVQPATAGNTCLPMQSSKGMDEDLSPSTPGEAGPEQQRSRCRGRHSKSTPQGHRISPGAAQQHAWPRFSARDLERHISSRWFGELRCSLVSNSQARVALNVSAQALAL